MNAVRHPAKHQAVALRLHQQGLSAKEIARRFAKVGAPVSDTTVLTWVSPEFRERRLGQQARANARYRAKRRKREQREQAIQRMVELRRAGLSVAAVSIVLDLYHGVSYAPETIRNYTCPYGPFPRGSAQLSRNSSANWGGK